MLESYAPFACFGVSFLNAHMLKALHESAPPGYQLVGSIRGSDDEKKWQDALPRDTPPMERWFQDFHRQLTLWLSDKPEDDPLRVALPSTKEPGGTSSKHYVRVAAHPVEGSETGHAAFGGVHPKSRFISGDYSLLRPGRQGKLGKNILSKMHLAQAGRDAATKRILVVDLSDVFSEWPVDRPDTVCEILAARIRKDQRWKQESRPYDALLISRLGNVGYPSVRTENAITHALLLDPDPEMVTARFMTDMGITQIHSVWSPNEG